MIVPDLFSPTFVLLFFLLVLLFTSLPFILIRGALRPLLSDFVVNGPAEYCDHARTDGAWKRKKDIIPCLSCASAVQDFERHL